ANVACTAPSCSAPGTSSTVRPTPGTTTATTRLATSWRGPSRPTAARMPASVSAAVVITSVVRATQPLNGRRSAAPVAVEVHGGGANGYGPTSAATSGSLTPATAMAAGTTLAASAPAPKPVGSAGRHRLAASHALPGSHARSGSDPRPRTH